jgi:guanylate kinase
MKPTNLRPRAGLLCVVSGPTSAGKTTVCRNLSRQPGYHYSISCTTRAPRTGEENGRDYYFLDPEEFDALVRRGEFLEHATVHGRRYGTLKRTVFEKLDEGMDVLMDLDVQGAAQLRACDEASVRRSLVDVFMVPSSLEEIRDRLRGRGTEAEHGPEFQLRLQNALTEISRWREYRYLLLSRTREEDLERLKQILEAESLRSSLQPEGPWPDLPA